ncbi:MAG: hypothetical protein WAV41_00695 [Microgenomates group bacterium]
MFVSLEEIDRRPSRHLLEPILGESIDHFDSPRAVAKLVNNPAFYNLVAQEYKALKPLRQGNFSKRLFNNYQGIEELIQQLPIVKETEVRGGAIAAATAVVFQDIETGGR